MWRSIKSHSQSLSSVFLPVFTGSMKYREHSTLTKELYISFINTSQGVRIVSKTKKTLETLQTSATRDRDQCFHVLQAHEMTTVESRKKAKEDYLKLLQQQKESVATIQNNPEIPTQLNSVTHDSKAGRREQLLAEKRKAFFEGKQAVASHPVETASSENKQIAPKTVPDFTAPVKEPQPSSKNENFRLSDWKKLGFLSEYAYAKHLGLLQDKKDIPPPADAATTDRLRLDNENNLLFPIKSLENPHIPSDVRAADRAANGLGLLEAQKKPQSEAHSINTAISNIDSNGMVDKVNPL